MAPDGEANAGHGAGDERQRPGRDTPVPSAFYPAYIRAGPRIHAPAPGTSLRKPAGCGSVRQDVGGRGCPERPHPSPGITLSGRNSSRTKTFDAADGETVAFRCTGKSILPIFLLSFVVPSLALSLHRE